MNKHLIYRTTLFFMTMAVASFLQAGQEIPDYPVDKVSEHVWVIHGPTEFPNKKNQGFMNNPAIIVTDVGVVIIDPGSSVYSGRMVLRQVKKLTDKPVTHVFNSHIHGDHWLGNHAIKEAYPEARIYAHPIMIEQAKTGVGEEWVKMMDSLTEGATRGTKAVIPANALSNGQEVKVGNLTFRSHLTDHAHTKTDLMVQIVEERLLITGDNVMFKRVGRMDDGNFRGNIKACEYALSLDTKTYVPGHGPSGGKEIVEPYCNLLKTLYSEAGKGVEEGLSDFEIKPKVVEILANYNDWPGFEGEIGRFVSLAVLEYEQAAFE
ncbi:MAG: MBL fold metallo-hydrolase [Gammaproteobacteria bacterium]|nr:MAG: MBL fold metallo-hydrolase [Gammaproteobacteria bacterium]